MRRYVLGLSLVVLTAPAQTYLRQGCNLVPDAERPRTVMLVSAERETGSVDITHDEALTFAKIAAEKFVVGGSEIVKFDPNLAKKDITGEGDVKKTRKSKATAAPKVPEPTEPA